MRIVPVTLDQANAFVVAHHRHHGRVRGHKFSIGAQSDGVLVGVAIVGRPVARLRNDGRTLEVTRLCTDGTRNAASMLLSACQRAVFAMGFDRLGTYTLASESGASLRGAGWRMVGQRGGGTWNCPSRPREDRHPTDQKTLWEMLAPHHAPKMPTQLAN